MKTLEKRLRVEAGIALGFAFVGWAVVFGLYRVLNFNMLVSDVGAYWIDSFYLNSFNRFHLPLYPTLIALIRSILPAASPIALMQIINFCAWIAGMGLVCLLLESLRIPRKAELALFFGFAPLVGLALTVYPVADTLSMTCFLVGLYGYFTLRRPLMVIGFAFTLLAHKMLWPEVALCVLIALVQKRYTLPMLLLTLVPFMIYNLAGAGYNYDILWMFKDSGSFALGLDRKLPVFDAIFGGLLSGTPKDILKFAAVASTYALAVFLLVFTRVWRDHPVFLGILLPVIAIGFVFNSYHALTIVRFGRLLLIPLYFYLAQRWDLTKQTPTRLIQSALIPAYASQLAFAVYVVAFFGR